MTGILRETFDDILRAAAGRAWDYLGPKVRNESDFKHELYHQLAMESIDGNHLNQLVPGTTSCRLHAETKVDHGRNSSKADLSICDPSKLLPFNYHVEHVLELKHRLKVSDLRKELRKFSNYHNRSGPLYLLSAKPSGVDSALVQRLGDEARVSISVIAPTASSFSSPSELSESADARDWKTVVGTVGTTIREVLELYGKGRKQYHGFFWCNYEQEKNKKQTYPCESDFLCQLYTRLRAQLPAGLRLLTEYKPTASAYRIDCVITDGKRALPIEAKMNWDQFEHKTVDGKRQEREASTIVRRFELLGREYEAISAKVIVIQMDRRQESNRKEIAFGVFGRSSLSFELLGYSEDSERVVGRKFGPH